MIYGHSFSDAEVLFTQLHRFEDADFFDSHEFFYLYLPDGRVFTYRTVSACLYTDMHILDAYGSASGEMLQAYFNFATSPGSPDGNERSGVVVDAADDRIVQLSTCALPAIDGARYVVIGVLIAQEQE